MRDEFEEIEIKTLMAGEAYQNPAHPEHLATVKEVEIRYQRLYPGMAKLAPTSFGEGSE